MPLRPVKPSDREEFYLTDPDNTLRKKIGRQVPLGEIFTPEKLLQCQQMVDNTMAEFVQEMEGQLNVIGDEFMMAAENPAQAEAAAKKVGEMAFIIKRRMEQLSFVFGFRVAQSLCDYIKDTPAHSPDALLIVCKHVAVLNLILKENIKGDGGVMGQEMLENLRALIEKARK